MTIELPPDVAAALAEAAARREMTPDALAAEILRDRLHPSPEPLPGHGGTLADFLAGYIGVFDSRESGGDSRMSEDCGKTFAEGMARKHARRQP